MKVIKILVLSILISMSLSFMAFGISEGRTLVTPLENYDTERVYYYVYEDYHFAKNEWKYVADEWYYFGDNEKSIQNTWAEIDGKWYYFDKFSVMLHDTTTPDGYTVGSDGAWITE